MQQSSYTERLLIAGSLSPVGYIIKEEQRFGSRTEVAVAARRSELSSERLHGYLKEKKTGIVDEYLIFLQLSEII